MNHRVLAAMLLVGLCAWALLFLRCLSPTGGAQRIAMWVLLGWVVALAIVTSVREARLAARGGEAAETEILVPARRPRPLWQVLLHSLLAGLALAWVFAPRLVEGPLDAGHPALLGLVLLGCLGVGALALGLLGALTSRLSARR